MKKNQTVPDDAEMLPEYDFSAGVRNKYAKGFGRSPNIRILAADLLPIFPDSESVNEALRLLVRIGEAAMPQKVSAHTATAPEPKKKKARS